MVVWNTYSDNEKFPTTEDTALIDGAPPWPT